MNAVLAPIDCAPIIIDRLPNAQAEVVALVGT
jgi:hypothetical protein